MKADNFSNNDEDNKDNIEQLDMEIDKKTEKLEKNKWYGNLSNLTDFANYLAQSGLIKNLDELDELFKNPEKYTEAFYFYKNEILGEEINFSQNNDYNSQNSDYNNYKNFLNNFGIGKLVIVEVDNIHELRDILNDYDISIDDIKNIKLFLLRNILLFKKHGDVV